jgi:hypothetical protein
MTNITSPIYSTVTLGQGGFTSPLTITPSGAIFPVAYGATGLYLDRPGVATIVNAGRIIGYNGSYFDPSTYNGGAAVVLRSAATISNSGLITGGLSGAYYNGGTGGTGIDAAGGNINISNTGDIFGGGGGASAGTPAYGGSGVSLTTLDTLTNSGMIAGGAGGDSRATNSYAFQGSGGAGVSGYSGATINNSGTIMGGAGGYSLDYDSEAYAGGAGIELSEGKLTNTGDILGGTGGGIGQGSPRGLSYPDMGGMGGQGAVVFNSNFSNAGSIVGGLGGYGVSYTGNGGGGVSIDGSASNSGFISGGDGRAAQGADAAGAGGYGLSVFGGTFQNTGVITGGTGGSDAAEGFGQGGNGGIGAQVFDGSTLITAGTIEGGAAGPYDHPGIAGDAVVLFGNAANTLIIKSTAKFIGTVVSDPGAVNVLEVAGKGTHVLAGIGTSFTGFTDISFATGAAWTIQGNAAGLTSGEEIHGFTAGDTIDLSFLRYNANATVKVATAGTVSITQGAMVTKIDIAGSTKGETDFHLGKDPTGGTDLTRGTQPQMAFLSPLFPHDVMPPAEMLPPLEQAGGWMEVGNQGRDHTSIGVDLRPYGAVPAVVTPVQHFEGMFTPVTLQVS